MLICWQSMQIMQLPLVLVELQVFGIATLCAERQRVGTQRSASLNWSILAKREITRTIPFSERSRRVENSNQYDYDYTLTLR